MLKRVPTIKTSCTPLELTNALIIMWKKLYNTIPSENSIAILYSQNALETNGTKNMYNFNIGNVKAKDNPNETIEYCALVGVWEIVNGVKVILSQEDPGSWFRSFPTLADGLEHHFKFLRNNRYKKSWEAVELGDARLFCSRLREAGYYTAPLDHYTNAVLGYVNRFKKDKLYNQALAESQNTSVPLDNNMQEPISPVHDITIPIHEPNLAESEPLKLTGWQNILNTIFKYFKK